MMSFLWGLLVGTLTLAWLHHSHQQHSLAYWKRRLTQAQQSYQALGQKHEQLTKRYQEIQQCLQELESEHQQLRQQVESSQQHVQELAQENQQLHQELANLRQEHNALLRQQAELLATYQEKASQLQQKVEQLQQEKQTLTASCNYLEKCALANEEKYISLQEQYDALQREYMQLQGQLFYYRPATATTPCRNTITLSTNEIDFYPDEIYELVLRLLTEELNRLPNDPNSYRRRRDLLKSLLDCNPCRGYSEQIRAQIEELFTNYTGMTKPLEAKLSDLGFALTEGHHYKITWRKDQRYTFSFAKTPSDYRAGRNIARDLMHLLF